MQRTRKNSRIEIWGYEYINNPSKREPNDRDVLILQIETAVGHVDNLNFIVEVIDKEEVEYLV